MPLRNKMILHNSFHAKNKIQQEKLNRELNTKLEEFASGTSAYPLLGLVEIQCWLQSRRTGKEIKTIFMQRLVKSEE